MLKALSTWCWIVTAWYCPSFISVPRRLEELLGSYSFEDSCSALLLLLVCSDPKSSIQPPRCWIFIHSGQLKGQNWKPVQMIRSADKASALPWEWKKIEETMLWILYSSFVCILTYIPLDSNLFCCFVGGFFYNLWVPKISVFRCNNHKFCHFFSIQSVTSDIYWVTDFS